MHYQIRCWLDACAAVVLLFTSCKPDDALPPVVTDPSDNTQCGTSLAGVPATDGIVMYEVNLRAFSNTGDFQGVINKLDQLQSLDVNVISLMHMHLMGSVKSPNGAGLAKRNQYLNLCWHLPISDAFSNGKRHGQIVHGLRSTKPARWGTSAIQETPTIRHTLYFILCN